LELTSGSRGLEYIAILPSAQRIKKTNIAKSALIYREKVFIGIMGQKRHLFLYFCETRRVTVRKFPKMEHLQKIKEI
jgi:hypothetical protein